MPDVCGQVARELSLDPGQVEAIVRLLDDGHTYLRGLQQRKEDVRRPVDEPGKLALEQGLAPLAELILT